MVVAGPVTSQMPAIRGRFLSASIAARLVEHRLIARPEARLVGIESSVLREAGARKEEGDDCGGGNRPGWASLAVAHGAWFFPACLRSA